MEKQYSAVGGDRTRTECSPNHRHSNSSQGCRGCQLRHYRILVDLRGIEPLPRVGG